MEIILTNVQKLRRVKSQALSPTQMATLRFAFNPSEDAGETTPIQAQQLELMKAGTSTLLLSIVYSRTFSGGCNCSSQSKNKAPYFA